MNLFIICRHILKLGTSSRINILKFLTLFPILHSILGHKHFHKNKNLKKKKNGMQ